MKAVTSFALLASVIALSACCSGRATETTNTSVGQTSAYESSRTAEPVFRQEQTKR